MADRQRMTVAEAAEALAVSDDTIRRGLAGTGPLADLLRDAGRRDNAGRWVIELSAEQVERNRSARRRQPTQPQEPLTSPAEAELIRLRERLDALRSAADAASGAHKEEIQRLVEGHRAELERQAAAIERERERADQQEARATAAEREREDARVRAAAAEGEAKGLREALAEARRPFWRRWLGA
jgi:hypothetical protein